MAEALPGIAHPAFLVALEVPSDRSLRIVLEERTGRGTGEGAVRLNTQRIVHASGDRIFEIVWDILVCFAVRGDPFPKGRPSTATICEIVSGDAFLAWVKSDSHSDPEYIAAMQAVPDAAALELRHWQVSCNEVLFDIASPHPPIVRRISG